MSEVGEFSQIPGLRGAAKKANESINEFKGPINFNLGFTLDIAVRSEPRRLPTLRRVDVGVLVESSPDGKCVENASYSVIICRGSNPASSAIVRKLHFDYAPKIADHWSQEPKPIIHMQVCGKYNPHNLADGYRETSLTAMYPRWEKPRIPVAPTCLAVVLNWLFLEFQADLAAQKILNNPRWRMCVVDAERKILTEYFQSNLAFLKSTANAKRRLAQGQLYMVEE